MLFLPILVFWLRSPKHRGAITRWSFLLTIGFSALVVLPYGFTEEASSPTSQSNTDTSDRFREGTRVVGLSGTFSENGRRWMMHAENSGPTFRILENLTLQRIANAITDDAQDNFWKVSGILTEFQNENFLLIDRIQRGTKSDVNQTNDNNTSLTE